MVELNNKVHGGRSILDYSLVACFTLILLLGIVVLDAAEYISVPGLKGAKGSHHAALEAATGVDILSNDELKELQKQIDDAKSLLASKHDEVQKIVHKVEVAEKEEEEVKTGVHHVDTAEEKKEEEKKEEEIVETVVEKELGIDKFCSGCQWGNMPFTCGKRISWMMDSYGITEEAAKMASLSKCHYRRLRGGSNGN